MGVAPVSVEARPFSWQSPMRVATRTTGNENGIAPAGAKVRVNFWCLEPV